VFRLPSSNGSSFRPTYRHPKLNNFSRGKPVVILHFTKILPEQKLTFTGTVTIQQFRRLASSGASVAPTSRIRASAMLFCYQEIVSKATECRCREVHRSTGLRIEVAVETASLSYKSKFQDPSNPC
jgi:hypothetical protein